MFDFGMIIYEFSNQKGNDIEFVNYKYIFEVNR